MKYKNAKKVLPDELIEQIQQYVQGEYIYIPLKERVKSTEPTEYKVELLKRDEHIYTKYLEGMNNKKISQVYSLSESSIRRIIIKQRKRYGKMKDRIKILLKEWEMQDSEIKQIHNHAWNINDKYILKVYDNITNLERNIKVVTILYDMRIPVGRIISTNNGGMFVNDEDSYFILTEKVKGNNIVSVKKNSKIAKEMGAIIADLHIAFKKCEEQDEFWENSLLDELNGWIAETLSKHEWNVVSEEQFNNLLQVLSDLYDKLPVQLIHRDVHFGNFLFDEGKFSGYIDFDLSQKNIRIFDLAYFSLSLLSEVDKTDVNFKEWLETTKQIFEGYSSKVLLTNEEKQAIPYVMMSIEILFMAWYISVDDIKCAESAMKIFEFINDNAKNITNTLKRIYR